MGTLGVLAGEPGVAGSLHPIPEQVRWSPQVTAGHRTVHAGQLEIGCVWVTTMATQVDPTPRLPFRWPGWESPPKPNVPVGTILRAG